MNRVTKGAICAIGGKRRPQAHRLVIISVIISGIGGLHLSSGNLSNNLARGRNIANNVISHRKPQSHALQLRGVRGADGTRTSPGVAALRADVLRQLRRQQSAEIRVHEEHVPDDAGVGAARAVAGLLVVPGDVAAGGREYVPVPCGLHDGGLCGDVVSAGVPC